ncbi:MAG: hypothetical protein HYS27_02385 [Deltaproteobacteria bacterium]|nr:hypothetical protein [Deltaproteobacteria bacterium]
MDGTVPRVVYSRKIRQLLREAEERLLVAARADVAVREALRAALAAGDAFLSEEGAREVADWPSSAPARRISSAVAGDLELLRLAALVGRVAHHGLALLAKASRWDGTLAGAELVAPGLLEPDVLGDDR